MKKGNKIALLLTLCLLSLIIIPLSSASNPTLGTFKQDSDVNLIQTCTNSTAFCAACNISSINYPNGTNILSTDVGMSKGVSAFNYTLISNYTNTVGQYTVNGYCTNGITIRNWGYFVNINPTGVPPSTSRTDATTRAIFFIFGLAVLFFIGFLYWKNESVKWTFFVLSLMFVLIGLNNVSSTLNDEIVSPSLIRFFDGLTSASTYLFWFAVGLIIVIWMMTFINTYMYKKNMEAARRFGYA